ncbi:DUF4870 domain-containing protein [Flavobacterium sp. W21_SRS_FM6]|uniref:DUF4870 domain-containing protein n=1 Tax=Flavobacterium sp. W21_SRS_FM6 TaxID=3240268 RepID=UPI003F93924E
MSDFENEVSRVVVDQDSKNLALLTWIGTIFFGFIPGLVMYLVKKDDAFICGHAKEALNWCITAAIGYFICFILTIILIGALLFPVLGLCHLIFCVLGAIKASNGEYYLTPFAIRLIK